MGSAALAAAQSAGLWLLLLLLPRVLLAGERLSHQTGCRQQHSCWQLGTPGGVQLLPLLLLPVLLLLPLLLRQLL